MSPGDDFNPKSTDAMFATILSELSEIRREREEDRKERMAQGEIIDELQKDKWYSRGVTAAIAVMAPGLWEWFKRSR